MTEPTPRYFGVLAAKRSPNHKDYLQSGVYTKEQVDEMLARPGGQRYLPRIVELVPVSTEQRKVTEIKEVIV